MTKKYDYEHVYARVHNWDKYRLRGCRASLEDILINDTLSEADLDQVAKALEALDEIVNYWNALRR